jgi:putative heme-binding domain-containing protein
VLKDYPVHGRGRIWRLVLPPDEAKTQFLPRSEADLAASDDAGDALQNAESPDPYLHAHGVHQLAQQATIQLPTNASRRLRLSALEAAWLHRPADVPSLLRNALHDDSPEVRLYAIRWIADERIMPLRDDVAQLLDGPQPNPQLYLAVLGAIDWLDHEPSHRGAEITDELLVRELSNNQRSPETHALALAWLKPDNKFLTSDRLRDYLQSNHAPLPLEATRTLAEQSSDKRFELLAVVAQGNSQSEDVRAEAIVGLAAAAEKHRGLLETLAASDREVLRSEAERALRLAGLRPAPAETNPSADDLSAWNKLLATTGDAAAGRRLFFSPVGARCSVCHKYGGRGSNVGPDLTHIGRSASRERIIASLLQPSREVAPDYQPWILVTNDGKTHAGLRLPKPGDSGQEEYADSAGNTFILASEAIEERHAATKSIMPDNLQATLSLDDLRDLITFLTATSH